jgi:hypothetical protein
MKKEKRRLEEDDREFGVKSLILHQFNALDFRLHVNDHFLLF